MATTPTVVVSVHETWDEANTPSEKRTPTSEEALALLSTKSSKPRFEHSDSCSRLFTTMDTQSVKSQIRASMTKRAVTVKNFYSNDGLCVRLVKHPWFENLTMAIIAINAVWMSIDTDWNKAQTLPEAAPLFQIVEHSFCAYFTFEVVVRFIAFERKYNAFKDRWFVFDSALVTMMVSETWILLIVAGLTNSKAAWPFGDASVLRLLRLLRLTRLMRMMRSFPAIMILIKGMMTASKAVCYVMLLLVIVTYIFSIAFTQLMTGTNTGDVYFHNVALGMYSLLVYATFLDNLSNLTDDLRADSIPCLFLCLIFICIACLTLMNMLVGVLCEVVAEVAEQEHEDALTTWVTEKLHCVADTLDTSHNGMVDFKEFQEIFHDKEALLALQAVGVDPVQVVDFAQGMFFEDSGKEVDLRFEEFMELVLELRETNEARIKDVQHLWKKIVPQLTVMAHDIEELKLSLDRMEQTLGCIYTELRKLTKVLCDG